MYTAKQLAELADICYLTLEKECSKPVDKIDIELVDACVDLANKLLNIQSVSDDQILSAKKKIEFMVIKRRKKLKVRIIAAVLAVFLLLGTTVYAFSEWIFGVFGKERLHNVQPGYSATVEEHEIEAPSDIIYFDSIEDLVEYVNEPIYIPTELSEEFVFKNVTIYKEENTQIEIIWTKANHNIRYKITFEPSYFNETLFNSHEYEYYSKDGYPFDYVHVDPYWQATSWINNIEYVITAENTTILEEIIDSLIVSEKD